MQWIKNIFIVVALVAVAVIVIATVPVTLPALAGVGGTALLSGVASVGWLATEVIDSIYNNQIIDVTEAKVRNPNPPARRVRTDSKKEAYERAKRAGKGKELIHNPYDVHGPHYHPNVEMPKNPTPHVPSPHDHYFYPR